MAEVRIALQKDKNDFYRLWKICFGDSDAFCDWFFENRFSPEHSVVLEYDKKTVSCMQAFPYTLLIRGKEIPGAMLCGVSTHPNERKKGHMGKIFSYEMNHLRKMGFLAAVHTPAVLPSYFSFGHFPVADANYLECPSVPVFESKVKLISVKEKDWCKLYPLYNRVSQKYSGIIKRTEADFLRKAADYSADGGKCVAYVKNNEIKGYAFYYDTEEMLLCVEAISADGFYHKLMEGLLTEAIGRSFSAKLPPELFLSFPFTKCVRKQKGVMGLCNISELLKKLQFEIPYTFRIYDNVVPENNGVYYFNGDSSNDDPVFEISAGHILQVLVGYYSLSELKHQIIIFNKEKFEEIDKLLPKQKCYIIDEY